MDFYYSITNVIADVNNPHRFFVNDPEALEELYKIFNEIEKGSTDQQVNTFQIKVFNSAEEEFLIDDDYRTLSTEQIYKIIASTQPAEFNCTGYRLDIMSARLLSIFQKSRVKEIISIPVKLIHPLTGRFWPNYFVVRFTGLKDRMKISSEPLFVDRNTYGPWFNENIMNEIAALKLPDITFTKMLPKKFP